MKVWGSLDSYFEDGPVFGRVVANTGFLRALLRRAPFDAYHFFLEDRRSVEAASEHLAREAPQLWQDGAIVVFGCDALPGNLATRSYDVFHLASCVPFQAHLTRLRNQVARELFPITGVTHTTSHAQHASWMLAHIWAGTTSRDAIVATSVAGEHVVRRTFEVLVERYRLPENFASPRIARIPLGVDLDMFSPAPELRAAARIELGAADDDVLFLIMGRISHTSKMDLLPVFAALERAIAAGLAPEHVLLVIAGRLDPGDRTPDLLHAAASLAGIRVKVVLNPPDPSRQALYAAADVFLSPIDNVQETFGLTVLEAGAMGLPAIVSDYDGYRDLVIDGVTGLTVPTLGPAVSEETDAVANLWFAHQYHLRLAQQTAVDVPALARAIMALASDPAHRRALGEAARQRVGSLFTWDRVIEDHLALWDELRSAPVDVAGVRQVPHPLHVPYSEVFAHHPTARLDASQQVRATSRATAVIAGASRPIVYGSLEPLLDDAFLVALFVRAREPTSTSALIAWQASEFGRFGERAQLAILWALKHDYLELA